jgi:hypothetical protein
VDQYTGSTANNRYTVAEEATNVNYTPPSKTGAAEKLEKYFAERKAERAAKLKRVK